MINPWNECRGNAYLGWNYEKNRWPKLDKPHFYYLLENEINIKNRTIKIEDSLG
jgi:hypothetical protein